ncbi:hypothetical protein TrCOL_g7729 [Triparma columacea]|uniref:Non-canonical E2 ubiquitin-conjugating enzyme C-terminal domain-containing protein n=1 Tax=Triparma columacea TaxID=722753 RepID=A0A9W7LB62_9STRA|nr:hypothetical protein TrCOL_g7729 [Triparma columacea]
MGLADIVGGRSITKFCRDVPLRLNERERILLNVLISALTVSEYTDNVDVVSRRNKVGRIIDGILEACAIATGLGLCGAGDASRSGLNAEMKEAAKRDPSENQELLCEMFEVGRRNKILNPASMRDTYGKLMYLLQDSQSSSVNRGLQFGLWKELNMVSPFLEAGGAEELLVDERLVDAVHPVMETDSSGERLSRDEVQRRVKRKRESADELVAEYGAKTNLSEEEIRRAIDSIADAYTVVTQNVRPCKRMLTLLKENFDPNKADGKFSLQLKGSSRGGSSYGYGMGRFGFGGGGGGGNSSGATLSHSHDTQWTFVWQTLCLWVKIQQHMHSLWVAADADLLSTTSVYNLWNTGQGLNRVQSCPTVSRMMHNLLSATQSESKKSWVGLSVVHLGDRDVPNALVFIDKYTQVPRILQPIADFVDGLDAFVLNPKLEAYVEEQFKGKENLKKKVLADYFKHGFDGSGDDGGSCIDGRLTSSWNWTSRIGKKSYYHAFLMSGFAGFDGEWK